MASQSEHRPVGDPCAKCGRAGYLHRVYHHPQGNPCVFCGLPAAKHRVHQKRTFAYKRRKRIKENALPALYLGVDGEGQGRRVHRYVLLAASDESGVRQSYVENFNGLSTVECLDFLLTLPTLRTYIFAYSFNYDLTKMLQDLPDVHLYNLFRPNLRPGKSGFRPANLYWNGYKLNLQGMQFTVARGDRRAVVWDLFKFYQSRFVVALKDWRVGTEDKRERMSHMKDKRADFDKETPEAVRAYCLEECQYMAELGRKLVDATNKAGLPLKSFHGAGSVAGALLKREKIREQLREVPPEMHGAVMQAFAGGRFENSVIGRIEERVISKDISSAYPYHITFLPCLVHGVWERTKDRKTIDAPDIAGALVHYGLGQTKLYESWGPFPFRDNEGSISFPVVSGGGWVWREEYIAGEAAFHNVQFKEAWILKRNCDCQPFKRIPEYYAIRVGIGKEGPGIIIKLGYNAVYGKIAQSVGSAAYNNWAWAGMITSGCRAQVLDVMAMHKDRANLLIVATDGIYTREDFDTPKPRETETSTLDAPCDKHGTPECECNGTGRIIKRIPLGGWEKKIIEKGVFIARPGIYFPLNPTAKELKEIRGRGVGKGVVLENWRKIVDSYERGYSEARVANVTRFCGAKSSVSRTGDEEKGWMHRRANGHSDETKKLYKLARESLAEAREADSHDDYLNGLLRAHELRDKARNQPSYGQWVTREVSLTFDPLPKRERVNPDGLTLQVRRFPRTTESAPYEKGRLSAEALLMISAAAEEVEQPDADLSDYEEAIE